MILTMIPAQLIRPVPRRDRSLLNEAGWIPDAEEKEKGS